MKAFHLLGAAPLYTNSFVLISDAGHAVVIDPAAEVQEYDKIFKENNATLTTILCTHGHYDHVGSAGVLSREWGAKLYCESADCQGTQLLPLRESDSGYAEGGVLTLTSCASPSGTPPATPRAHASRRPTCCCPTRAARNV